MVGQKKPNFCITIALHASQAIFFNCCVLLLVRFISPLNYKLIFGIISTLSSLLSCFWHFSTSFPLEPPHCFLDFPATSHVAGELMEANAIVSGGNGVEDKRYPAPLAPHEDVIKDSSLFFDTLRKFHSALGTKFMVPVIGGKELNLHVLYVEVTNKGGYEKVVSHKKWREVSSIFMFSPTTTSASYALRKHYFSLLYQYEQVYFFRLQDPWINSDSLSFQAPGTIDGKFDCGYLVSVKLGSEILNGVLYHPGQPTSASSEKTSCTAIVPYTPQPHGSKHSGRKNRKRRGGDPNRPKPNRSGYNFFFAEKHSMLKSQHPNREREFTKMIGESWNNLTPDERMVYQNYGLKDKERYQRELKEYKESMKIRDSS